MKYSDDFFYLRRLLLTGLLILAMAASGKLAAQPIVVGSGDSIGEGVQGGDAAWQTQVFSYLNWINFRMGGDLILPYIQTTALGTVSDTSQRSRLLPNQIATNV